MGTDSMTIPEPKKKKTVTRNASGSAEGGQTTMLTGSGWQTALAVAIGTIGAGTAVQKFPGFYTLMEREAKPADANGAGAVEAHAGFDTRWMAAGALAGVSYLASKKKLVKPVYSKLLLALAAGVGLSWATDKVRGMEWAQPKGAIAAAGAAAAAGPTAAAAAAAGPTAAAAAGFSTGEIDTGRVYLDDADSGALGIGKRLQHTRKEIGQLRAKRERLEDVAQSRLENRQAHGKRLSPREQAFLAREQAEDARQTAARRPRLQAPGIAQSDWVRVPVAAVRPGYLAQIGA